MTNPSPSLPQFFAEIDKKRLELFPRLVEALEYYASKDYHSERYEDGTLQFKAEEVLKEARWVGK